MVCIGHIGGSRGESQAVSPLICKKSLKLTVTFLKLEKIFEIEREIFKIGKKSLKLTVKFKIGKNL
jgi:hypothetical protein